MAPEVYQEDYSMPIGICHVEMVCRGLPKNPQEAFRFLAKVMEGEMPPDVRRIRQPELQALFENCIDKDPQKRPSAQNLLERPWLQENANDGHQLCDLIPEDAGNHTGGAYSTYHKETLVYVSCASVWRTPLMRCLTRT